MTEWDKHYLTLVVNPQKVTPTFFSPTHTFHASNIDWGLVAESLAKEAEESKVSKVSKESTQIYQESAKMASATLAKKSEAQVGNSEKQVYKTAEEVNTEKYEGNHNTASLRFNEEIKILLIAGPDWRIICHFMGTNAVRDVKVAKTEAITLIGFLQQEALIRCMEEQGYSFAGEISFDQNGQAIPVSKHTWQINGEEIIFTNSGYMFFDANTGKREDNVAFMAWHAPNTQQAGLTCYSSKIKRSKNLLESVEAFTKKNNALRGAKMRDVHVGLGTFQEVIPNEKYTWDNYYFSQTIRDLFDLEVFGFLRETERYNARGIKKRGLLLYGQPGTGKTTIGHIICNYAGDKTVIWITPDLIVENNTGKMSVKLLYLLADYVSPAVILLEDLDLFTEDRDSQQGNMGLGALMNILDGVNSVQNAVTIATTNRLELIEKALSNRPGRFDSVVEVPPLEAKLRRKMFTDRLAECQVEEGVVEYLVARSDDWTGAETQEFINRMNLYFINNNQDDERVVTKKVVETVLTLIETLCLSHKQKGKKGMGFGM